MVFMASVSAETKSCQLLFLGFHLTSFSAQGFRTCFQKLLLCFLAREVRGSLDEMCDLSSSDAIVILYILLVYWLTKPQGQLWSERKQ